MGGVGRVEVRVELEGVVSVALQGADAQIVVDIVAGAQGVADRVGQQRVGADLDEGVVIGAGMSDGLVEPYRVAHVGCPVLGVEPGAGTQGNAEVGVGGGDDRDGRRLRGEIGQFRTHRRLQCIHGRVVGATSMLTRVAKPFCWRTLSMSSSINSGGPEITVWRGEA
ncbi:phthiocerol synthesis polyketide synthase type I PpsC [Mycobacterium tuberculosis variant africanum]|nr:phthiocerol synthesis polyketide synthase type I PpsC [Mycobacterium tuberculosis variant africanum]